MLPKVQAAYRSHHSTETAVAKVLSDILHGVRRRWCSMPGFTGSFCLIWHRWSWSTVAKTSHNLRGERCGTRLVPFVLDRSPPICQSPSKPVVYGPHALRCTARISSRPELISNCTPLTSQHGLHVHLCADDTQVYGSCSPLSTDQLQLKRVKCFTSHLAHTATLICSARHQQKLRTMEAGPTLSPGVHVYHQVYAGTKRYCLATEADVRKRLDEGRARKCSGWDGIRHRAAHT